MVFNSKNVELQILSQFLFKRQELSNIIFFSVPMTDESHLPEHPHIAQQYFCFVCYNMNELSKAFTQKKKRKEKKK